jgi:hypothetical protein
MDIREKLVELLDEAENQYLEAVSGAESSEERYAIVKGAYGFYADHLLANNVTVQEAAYWKDVMQINGECFAYCSNCFTEHKAQNYASLVLSHRHCRWCGRRLITTPFSQPPKGE